MRKNVFKRATAALLGATVITFAAPAVTATATTPPASESTRLLSGQKLMPGQSMINGQSELVMQSDGNLVLYLDSDTGHRGPVLWASGTYGNPNAYAHMQPDGNFVVYRQGGPDAGGGLWSSGTWGHPGSEAYLWNGWLAVSGQGLRWDTHTGLTQTPGGAPGDTLDSSRTTLWSGSWLESNSVWLIMQLDGNLVLYRKRDGAVLWASGSQGHPDNYAHVWGSTSNPALFLSSVQAGKTWELPIQGRSGDRAKVQDDGNFVLYGSDGTVRWSTGTWGNW
ncbi:hypothetical protein ACFYS8_18560 [Kitasatospora sp. NPDC004615]|uniref:hypothetical protein n=1 Tax=Kitasatospora sp. NPDC004615 TaxID=3364017 RepID=UPI0036A2BCDF